MYIVKYDVSGDKKAIILSLKLIPYIYIGTKKKIKENYDNFKKGKNPNSK
jgi:hypothetical protein